jgi:DnaJ-class molecular chaperone
MSSECFYKILNISETATSDEIKKSYRQLSMKWHPDKNLGNPEATSQFQKINDAYETLSDPDKKREYDLKRNNPFFQNGMNFGAGGANFAGGINVNDLNNLFSGLFNQQGGFGMPPGVRIFTTTNTNFIQKPQPIQNLLVLSLEQILSGTTIPVEIERFIIENNVKTIEKETIYVPIPKGIDEGEIIILQDKGNIINTTKGDVKIFIKIENTTAFKRSGLDLIYDKKITLKEALCGLTFELKHLNGKLYTINNNAGSVITPNYKKIIPNMGLQRDSHHGNLIISFEIVFPDKISDEVVKKLLEIL